MRIRCPECQLEREINLDAIPAAAVMATCPQCKMKFRFRESVVGSAAPMPTDTARAPESDADDDGTFAAPVRLAPPPVEADTYTPSAARSGSRAEAPRAGAPQTEPHRTDPHRAETLRAENHRAENAEAADTGWLDVPWERPDRYGHLMGLYQTIVRVLFSAPKFFAALPRCRGSIMRPLLFYVLLGLFQVLVKLLWFRSIDPSMTDPQVQELLSSADMSLAMTFIVSPGILALQLFLYAALFFLMLRLVQPEAVTFPVVLRVVAYSAAPLIVCAVPVIGPMVAMVWFAVSCFMGCRFALNLPWLKVALALIPLYLIGFAITMQFVQHLLSQA